MNSEVIDANKRVHSSLILSGEYLKSPHRSVESAQRVRSILGDLGFSSPAPLHLDIGCGDGFMFECKPEKWVSHGVDATPEMLSVCSKAHTSVRLHEGLAENLPFEDSIFDVVTCYSFLDHLESTERFYSEAMRVLKPCGYFYFGLSPNRSFYISLIQSRHFELSDYLKSVVDIEIEFQKAFNDGTYYEEKFGINKEDLFRCEPGKSIDKGLSPLEEQSKLEALGIRQIKIVYEWLVQQNRHDSSVTKTMTDLLPFSSSCFKYFDLLGIK